MIIQKIINGEGATQKEVRGFILRVLAVVIVLAFAVWLQQYFRNGSLTVTATDNAAVTLTPVDSSAKTIQSIPKKQAIGTLKTSVPAGTYIITIESQRSALLSKTITVKNRQASSYSFKTPRVAGGEAVLHGEAHNITVESAQQLTYLDTQTNTLAAIDAQNNIANPYINQPLQSIQWGSPLYGVGSDGQGNLYKISGGQATSLTLPVTYKSGSYAVTPEDDIYFTVGADIYYGTPISGFTKIYTSKIQAPQIAVYGDKVALVQVPDNGSEDDKATTPLLEIINNSGKLLTKQVLAGDKLLWSPDGKRLAIINYAGASYIYNIASHSELLLPSKSISAAQWGSNSTLFYGVGSSLWKYNIDESEASAIGITSGSNITEIAIDDSNSFIYVASGSDETASVNRFSLDGEKIPDYLYQLGIYFPANLEQCSAEYINFTKPTIILHPFSSLVADDCHQEALALFANYEIDLSKVAVVTGDIDTGND